MTDDSYLALDKRAIELKNEAYLAIGKVTLEWNKLQESLAALFARVLNARSEAMALDVWHSQDSDRAQRKMLRAAIDSSSSAIREEVATAIKWLVNEADELSNKRNQTIHTHFSLGFDKTLGKLTYQPDPGSHSKHAQALAKKDPIPEFRKHAEWAGRLSVYAIELRGCVPAVPFHRETGPLPDKPRRPDIKPRRNRKG